MTSASHESAFRRPDQHGAARSSARPHRGRLTSAPSGSCVRKGTLDDHHPSRTRPGPGRSRKTRPETIPDHLPYSGHPRWMWGRLRRSAPRCRFRPHCGRAQHSTNYGRRRQQRPATTAVSLRMPIPRRGQPLALRSQGTVPPRTHTTQPPRPAPPLRRRHQRRKRQLPHERSQNLRRNHPNHPRVTHPRWGLSLATTGDINLAIDSTSAGQPQDHVDSARRRLRTTRPSSDQLDLRLRTAAMTLASWASKAASCSASAALARKACRSQAMPPRHIP